MDCLFGTLSVHLDCPQCFSAEIYAADCLDEPGHVNDDVKVPTSLTICSACLSAVLLSLAVHLLRISLAVKIY